MKEKKVRVFTSGSFDLFHIGHLNILEKSALLGDELIVSNVYGLFRLSNA